MSQKTDTAYGAERTVRLSSGLFYALLLLGLDGYNDQIFPVVELHRRYAQTGRRRFPLPYGTLAPVNAN